MKIAIRDDDTCYFTAPETLARVYHDVWDRVPVCLATVPYAIGYERAGIPREHWHSGEAFPLERNGALVAALKELVAARRATIALHGYTHQDFPNGFEFQAAPDPERRVSDGLRALRDTLAARISVFVPPHNALSKRGLAAVGAAGLNILGSFLSFRPSMRPWDLQTFGNWWRVRRFRESLGRSRRDRLVYPHVLRYATHGEFGCHSLVPGTTLEELMEGFAEARRAGGDFCLATHYWEVDGPMKAVMLRFLDHAAAHADVRFVAAEELFTV
jgi:predicted deacetylase